ncbi:neuroligin-2 [Aplysia californica]|uniref:Carboxylic ester hydrolase n=1 Tax=Aplysia californica TaxID=6500 RepID=A0ABM1A2P2_APLCA|nr:neuroligin-2 [Aplysia californica]
MNVFLFLVVVVGGVSGVLGAPFEKNTEPQYTTVTTLYGAVRGVRQQISPGKALDIFLGIPYAKPPVGQLRFARPQFPAPWKDTRDALKFGAQCAQRPLTSSPQADLPYSEDCLYLNIYAPRFNTSTVKLPVLFWIHGGGYFGGTGALYNGTELALRGVIVVTINYRLDLFGFLSTADSVIPGNFGMLDQVLAMEWVRDNIAAFGGDPNDVTLAGESAGASSVSLHLLSPLSRGKFHKAIMESGVSLCPWAWNHSNVTYYAPKPMANTLGLGVGCSHEDSHELLSCLRRIETDYLVNTSIGLQKTLRDAMVWVPVVETTFGFLPNTPEILLQKGLIADVPTIRGYNKNELALSVKDPEDQGYSIEKFGELLILSAYFFFQKDIVATVAEIELVYRRNQTSAKGRRSDYERLMSDYYMIAPISYEAQLHSKLQKRSKSYLYEFAHRPTFTSLAPWQGVVHTDELAFVFGLPRGPSQLAFNTTDPGDIKVADIMVTMWTNFVKTGNPTPPPPPLPPTPEQSHKEDVIISHYAEGELKELQRGERGRHLGAKPSQISDVIDFVWPALNDAYDSVLEINTATAPGKYLRVDAEQLWMVRIPRIQNK